METNYQTMNDGKNIVTYKWMPKEKPKAIIHIVHGMAEHALRYTEFAEQSCKLGFGVYASDHRGHGATSKNGQIGYLADTNGFLRLVEDQKELNSVIKEEYPNTPIVILGHSFGSFVGQSYIEKYSDTISGCVLCGSAGPNSIVKFGLFTANIICFLSGKKKPSKLFNKLTFSSYNKKIKNTKTAFDWLSRDEEKVQEYINDKLCGFICTAGFYRDLMKGLNIIHKKSEIEKISKNLPVLIASGSDDPVSGFGETVKQLYQIYKDHGIKNVDLKIYKKARHEILNEINREEIKKDIFDWIEKTIS